MSTEYLQFAGAIVLMVGILIVSYWFVYVPDRRDSEDGRGPGNRDLSFGSVKTIAGVGQD